MKKWSNEETSLLTGLTIDDRKAIKSVAKKTKRTFMSVYGKIYTMNRSKPKVKKRRTIKNLLEQRVRVTGSYVIVSGYKNISLKDGNVRIKL